MSGWIIAQLLSLFTELISSHSSGHTSLIFLCTHKKNASCLERGRDICRCQEPLPQRRRKFLKHKTRFFFPPITLGEINDSITRCDVRYIRVGCRPSFLDAKTSHHIVIKGRKSGNNVRFGSFFYMLYHR